MTRATSGQDVSSAEVLRAAMVGELRNLEAIRSEHVAEAFSIVPRHLFAPEVSLESAYAATQAVVTRRDAATGRALSAVSESHIQATMLEQARLEPGMRVLEVGSGGYQAALMAELVGAAGQVTTVDIDPEVVDRARRCLDAAGYDRVQVVLADAENGVPESAPYDRLVVSAGAWDVPPAWVEQLAEGGLIVVPLRLRGLTRSVTLEHDDGRLVSKDHRLCGFVPIQGAGGHLEWRVPLKGDDVWLSFDDGQQINVSTMSDALASPRLECWSGVEIGGFESMDELDLWIATAADHFALLRATPEAIEAGQAPSSARLGAKTIVSGDTLAYRPSPRPLDSERTRFEFGAYAHGPEAKRFVGAYADLIRLWDSELRGQTPARIEVHPASTSDEALPACRVIDKRHTRVVVSWPDSAWETAAQVLGRQQ